MQLGVQVLHFFSLSFRSIHIYVYVYIVRCATSYEFHCFYLIFEALCLIWTICLCLSISWLFKFSLHIFNGVHCASAQKIEENQNISFSSKHTHTRSPFVAPPNMAHNLCISFHIHSYACNFRRSLINQIDFAKVKYTRKEAKKISTNKTHSIRQFEFRSATKTKSWNHEVSPCNENLFQQRKRIRKTQEKETDTERGRGARKKWARKKLRIESDRRKQAPNFFFIG